MPVNMIELALRGGALFFGAYFFWSWVMYFTGPMQYDATIWWVDIRFLPGWLAMLCSMAFSAALLHRAICPAANAGVMRGRQLVLGCLLAALILNTLMAWRVGMDRVLLGVPIPLTAVLAAGVWFMLRRSVQHGTAPSFAVRISRSFGIACFAGGFALLAALAQMFWFGESDYRRPADVILVYGCKAHADGRPSQALADRVHTASELYHQGLAEVIVMSGGPVRDSVMHETQVMADYAVSLGVPREAILFDVEGLDTQATARNLRGVLADAGTSESSRILAVSHDYHLPRVKLSLEREGLTAYTVPAEIRYRMPGKPYFMARETAAWWYYYFQPILAIDSL